MKRIFYWNIERFSINKINDPRNINQPHTTITRSNASVMRLDYITDQIFLTAPEVIVVVEVGTAYTGDGRLVSANGAGASMQLLSEIRQMFHNNWMLVPPLQTGPNEAVAVFFDSTNLAFCGPWQWPGGLGPAFDPAAVVHGVAANYPHPFNIAGLQALPAMPIPAGAPNAGQAQNTMAARATGYTVRAGFPAAGVPMLYTGNKRDPYCVRFAETNALGVYQRTISLFAIHAPANAWAAGQYMDELSRTAQIVDGIGADEVRVVVGDFNVNLLNNNALRTLNAHYNGMTGAPINYTLGINRLGAPPPPPAGPAPPAGSMYDGYYATHIKPWGNAAYWSTMGETQYYPGFGYIGSGVVANAYAIDNILARYGAGHNAGGPMNNVTILNGITGSPYHNLAAVYPAPPPALNAPLGNYAVNNDMNTAPFTPAPNVAPAHAIGNVTSFRNWYNYLHVRSTSDHLPIVADI